jgi:uncharacterized protein (TIGR00661 family)
MNILYGVPSEGMGHATRSEVVIQFLLQEGHEVTIVSSDKAYAYLSQKFPNRVIQIEGFHLAFQGNEISIRKTFWETLRHAPHKAVHNIQRYLDELRGLTFDLIISDFESFAACYALLHRKPLLSIDNMQIMHRCALDVDIPLSERLNYELAKQIIQWKVPQANTYLITSFFVAEPILDNTIVVQSVLREKVEQLSSTQGKHSLVYSHSIAKEEMAAVLMAIPSEEFFVYGYQVEENWGNVHFRKFSEDDFLQQLASAKMVLCNGGFSFLSEAIYLRKPIFCVPIANQFEQYMNAAYVAKLGFGYHSNQFNENEVKSFIIDIQQFRSNYESIDFNKLPDWRNAIRTLLFNLNTST